MPLPRAPRILLALWPLVAVAVGMVLLQSAWAAILLYHLGVVVCLVRLGRSGFSRLVSKTKPLRAGTLAAEIALAIALGLIAFGSVRLALPVLVGEGSANLWEGMGGRLASYGLSGSSLVAFAIYFVCLHPLLEEAAWRGPLLGRGERSLRWEDGAFALYHIPVLHCLFPGAWTLLVSSGVILTAAAWFWRQRARIDGSLRSVAFQHVFADAGILAAVLVG